MGLSRQASTLEARPMRMPAWGPPRSLSPEKIDKWTPLDRLSLTVGSPARPNGARDRRLPLPKSSMTVRFFLDRARPAPESLPTR